MIKEAKKIVFSRIDTAERYLKTDLLYLFKGGFWLSLGQLITAFSGFILSIALANLLSSDTYGEYKYVLSIYSVLTVFTLSGINTSILQSVSVKKSGSFLQALYIKIKWGALGGILSILISAYYFFLGNIELSLSFCIAALFLPFLDSFSLYDSLLQGKKDLRRSTLYYFYSQIIALGFTFLVLYINPYLPLVILSYFLPWTFSRLVFLFYSIKKYKPTTEPEDKDSINYGFNLSLINLVPIAVQNLDKILVFNFLNPSSLAIYTLALAFPDQIKSLVKSGQVLILSKIKNQERTQSSRAIDRKLPLIFLLLILVTIAYILVAPLLYSLFFPKYLEAISYSQLYSLSIIGMAFIFPLTVLQFHKAQKELFKFNLIRSIVQLFLVTALTFYFGIVGAIWARIVIEFLNLTLVRFLSH